MARKWPAEGPGNIWNGSFDVYWLNEADNALHQLAGHLESENELGLYVRTQAGKDNAALVLLVTRLLDSHYRGHRIAAARVLLALGHGDQQVRDVLSAFMRENKRPVITDDGKQMQYTSERDEALKLDMQYKLGLFERVANKSNER